MKVQYLVLTGTEGKMQQAHAEPNYIAVFIWLAH
jgi:hypothetical protein